MNTLCLDCGDGGATVAYICLSACLNVFCCIKWHFDTKVDFVASMFS